MTSSAAKRRHFGADLVVTPTDSWVFRPGAMRGIPWIAWTPVDREPAPNRKSYPQALEAFQRCPAF